MSKVPRHSDFADRLPHADYFEAVRAEVIGSGATFDGPYGRREIIYADWVASGRLYRPIERAMTERFGPYLANTHTETSITGSFMTRAYHEAKAIIKMHVNAGSGDVLIPAGSGMTGAVNKFQRILGLKVPEQLRHSVNVPEADRPVVFITHMEHHSNQTSWLETIADVEIIHSTNEGLVDLEHLKELLDQYADRRVKYASVTACSNVTGIEVPIHEIARLMHEHDGFCFVDYACSAPYVLIDMHPADPMEALDAIFFSPHKFLGGPGSAGILILNSRLYHNRVPDQPGGGTVRWTNPWKEHRYVDEIEEREDGGTPPFLQTIRAALAIRLKEELDATRMKEREQSMTEYLLNRMIRIPSLHVLAENIPERLGVLSFYIDGLHYNLGSKLLNDRFGIQVRGGCSCAGTYGHYLLHVSKDYSHRITSEIDKGDLSLKPGWIRVSLHPVMSEEEVVRVADALESLAENHKEWASDYEYDPHTNEFDHKTAEKEQLAVVSDWFKLLPLEEELSQILV
ncbi:MAG TPA: aminotransferase class V-fold PLP-dependent enzyme [Candidatus Kapabacteria bacterium]|nr:aminotransferase class V-fold PLP-dependent enzyme [Candidatus Kapabacteria bacterium]